MVLNYTEECGPLTIMQQLTRQRSFLPTAQDQEPQEQAFVRTVNRDATPRKKKKKQR
jgi:hypothetical protein